MLGYVEAQTICHFTQWANKINFCLTSIRLSQKSCDALSNSGRIWVFEKRMKIGDHFQRCQRNHWEFPGISGHYLGGSWFQIGKRCHQRQFSTTVNSAVSQIKVQRWLVRINYAVLLSDGTRRNFYLLTLKQLYTKPKSVFLSITFTG